MAEENKGVSLIILGIVAVLAIVGLVLLFSKAGSTGNAVNNYESSLSSDSSDNSVTGEFKLKAPKISLNKILGKKTTGKQVPVATPSPAPVYSSASRIVRCVNGGDIFESVQDTNKCEVSNQRYVGPLGFILKNQEAGTALLQRCMVGGREAMTSTDPNCEGQQKAGSLGYIYTSAQPNTVPLYRCYTGKDHFLSLQSNCDGAKKEGVTGHILTSRGPSDTVSMSTPQDPLKVNQLIGSVRPTLTDYDLNGLKGGVITTKFGVTRYNQYLQFPPSGGRVIDNGIDNFGNKGDFLYWQAGVPMFNWKMDFENGLTSSVIGLDLQDLKDKTFNILGKNYEIIEAFIGNSSIGGQNNFIKIELISGNDRLTLKDDDYTDNNYKQSSVVVNNYLLDDSELKVNARLAPDGKSIAVSQIEYRSRAAGITPPKGLKGDIYVQQGHSVREYLYTPEDMIGNQFWDIKFGGVTNNIVNVEVYLPQQ